MIYKKDANFPYPIITEEAGSYADSVFLLRIEFEEKLEEYRFIIKYELSSPFIKKLLLEDKVQLLLVIQSKDSKFYKLDFKDPHVDILKRKLSLSNRTSFQLYIVAKKQLSFSENNDLNKFYDKAKDRIIINPYSTMGFTNVVTFEGSLENSTKLFQKRLNPNLKSAVQYSLEGEYIVIHFREEEYQLQTIGPVFMNPYLYTGLRMAMERFIRNNGEKDYDSVSIKEISDPIDLLDYKLFHLMDNKSVRELNYENIDEVIAIISNGIIEKYVHALKGLKQGES